MTMESHFGGAAWARDLLLAAAWLGAVATAGAAPVHYNEATDGDLVYVRNVVPHLLAFDAGANTVTGTAQYTSPAGGGQVIDLDGFRFSLSPTLRLDSVSVTFAFTPTSNGTLTNGSGMCADFDIISTAGAGTLAANRAAINYGNNPCVDASGPAVGSGGLLWGSLLPLTNGLWEVTPAVGTNSGGGGKLDYSFTFNVSSTAGQSTPGLPEPGSCALALVGLAALARTSRRRPSP